MEPHPNAAASNTVDNADGKLPPAAVKILQSLDGMQLMEYYKVLLSCFDDLHREQMLSALCHRSQQQQSEQLIKHGTEAKLMEDRIDFKVNKAQQSVQVAIEMLSKCQDLKCTYILQAMQNHLLEPAGASLSDLAQCQFQVHLMLVEQASSTSLDLKATCPEAAKGFVEKADRDLRDLVMLRIVQQTNNLKDPQEFDAVAKSVYGEENFNTEFRAKLYLSYHKDSVNQKDGFASMNQHLKKTKRRTRP